MVHIKSYKRVTPLSITELWENEVMVYGVKKPKEAGFVSDCASYFGSYHAIPEDMREGSGYIIPVRGSNGSYLTKNEIDLALAQFYHYAVSHKKLKFYLTRVGFENISPYSAKEFKGVLTKLSKLSNVYLPVSAWKVV